MAGKRDPQDPRKTILGYCTRAAVRISPRIEVLENVRMLAGPTFGHYLESSLATLRRAGYAADYRVLNAVNFRVAQRRERVVIMASRTVGPGEVREALDDLAKKRHDQIAVRNAL